MQDIAVEPAFRSSESECVTETRDRHTGYSVAYAICVLRSSINDYSIRMVRIGIKIVQNTHYFIMRSLCYVLGIYEVYTYAALRYAPYPSGSSHE